MSLLRDRLYTKVLMNFMWLSLFVAVIGLVSYIQNKQIENTLGDLSNRSINKVILVKSIHANILSIHNESLLLLIALHHLEEKTPQSRNLQPSKSHFLQGRLAIYDALEGLREINSLEQPSLDGKKKHAAQSKNNALASSSGTMVIQRLDQNITTYFDRLSQFNTIYQTQPEMAETLMENELAIAFKQVMDDLEEIDRQSSRAIDKEIASVKSDLSEVLYILTGATIAAILFSIVFGQYFAHRVSDPLVKLRDYIRNIEKSGYKDKVPEESSWYLELDQVRESFNLMIVSLQKHLANLKEQRKIAEEANLAKSEFLASMSHEIRTPMNGVIGMLNLLRESELSTDQVKKLDMAYSSAHSLLSIINDILDFSKIEAGKLEFEHINFDLGEIFEEVSNAMSVLAKAKGLDITLDKTELECTGVMGDSGRIRQIITNLLANAIKFTETGAIKICVASETDSHQKVKVRFTVEDTGIGIPEHKLDQLFERFTQVDASDARRYGGTGLGLSIVQTLVNLMDGDVSVASKLNEGSRFTVILLLDAAEKEPHHLTQAAVNTDTAEWPSGTRILVAEDIFINQEVIRAMLNNLGLQADIAADGMEVLEQLAKSSEDSPYTLLLMDCQMPEMDGYQATQAIRTGQGGDRYQTLPVIALTANAMESDKEKCFSAGMDDFLAKPVDPNELKQMLSKWINESITA